MGETNTEHTPLLSGIQIRAVKDEGGTLTSGGRGTLTGLATIVPDGGKVLVTNQHVLTSTRDHGGLITFPTPSGYEVMYQDDEPNPEGTAGPRRRVGSNPRFGGVTVNGLNTVDVALCTLDTGVTAAFKLHGHPTHTDRYIVEGVKEPTVGMRLLMLGGYSGERIVTVTEINAPARVGKGENLRRFGGVARLDVGNVPLQFGDSGSPCLFQEPDGTYRMCCIIFAGPNDEEGNTPTASQDNDVGAQTNTATAFRAGLAEQALGFVFGKRAPSANAGYDHLVGPGNTVTLDGSGTTDSDGDTLTYLWEQVPDVQHTVALSSATAVSPTFTAPNTAATLSFRLTVKNSHGITDTDTVSVTVQAGAESLGGLAHGQTYNRTGSWSSKVPSVNRSGRYAKFYGFSLSRRAKVQIDLSSSVDPYLYLLAGAGTSGSVLAYNNDVGVSGNSRIIQTLDAGAYTLEATTYAARQVGSFTLAVQVYSNDATLSGLSLSASSASLTPAFASDEESYTASVGNAISSVRVTPTVNEANATVTVKGTTVASGQQSGPISLSVGENTITVVVTAEDGTTKTYTVDVTRAAAPTPTPTPTPDPTPTPPPATEIWGPWTDTGNTMSIGGGHWVKEQQRTSSLGNTETQWVLI